MSIELRQATTKAERRAFLTFPWRIYRDDPLRVPPLLSEQMKAVDPAQGNFYKNGMAELYLALRDGEPVGRISLAEDFNRTETVGYAECMIGFVECIEDYAVFAALMDFAAGWAQARGMRSLYGPYNLDREDSRGVLIEGRDRPPAMLCAHHPPYYQDYFERYGFAQFGEDGLAYAIDIDLESPRVQRLLRVAERIQARHPEFSVRGANAADIDSEIDRIVYLQNRGLAHFEGHVPYTRADIEVIILPLVDLADMELVLFAEVDGEPAGFLPGIPNFNEVLIHLNGLRHPWDYLRALRYQHTQPTCLAIKSIVVPPEYWDTGVAVVMLAEMARRASAKGYTWADLSITGAENKDTWPLAHNMGAQIYKRYRIYKKDV